MVNIAEFCKECFLKYNPECAGKHMIMSKDLDLCEGCGQFKPVVEGYRIRLFTDILIEAITDRIKRSKGC